MNKELREELTIWGGAVLIAMIASTMAVPADAQDSQSLYLDNSVKVAPPPRPSVETVVVPGEHQEGGRHHIQHSHNEKRLKKQLEEQRAARDALRGNSGNEDRDDSRDKSETTE
jgi:hypothetical protein